MMGKLFVKRQTFVEAKRNENERYNQETCSTNDSIRFRS